jgi:AraC-like DNA-binding protein
MADRFRITKGWALRFEQEKISVPLLLRRAGLPANLFEQEKIFVTTAQVFAIWRTVAEMNRDPAFGLKLGTELRFERSHPVAIAGVCSRSFGDALERLARYKQLTCPEEIRVDRKAKESSVDFFFVEAREPQPDIMVDIGLSWILNVARRGSDGEIKPLRLELTRSPKNRELLEKHFGCPVRFKANRNALIFRSRDLDLPFVTYNEELLEVIGTHMESELNARNGTVRVGEQVKDALKRSLAGKRPTLQDVGRELGLGARTLQRRLTAAGISFQQLLEETRRDLAHHYLKQTAIELNETAFLLGFEDANSFYRAFQIWEGTTPGEWRTRHGARVIESVHEEPGRTRKR